MGQTRLHDLFTEHNYSTNSYIYNCDISKFFYNYCPCDSTTPISSTTDCTSSCNCPTSDESCTSYSQTGKYFFIDYSNIIVNYIYKIAVTTFCTDCSNRQTMEFGDKRIPGWSRRRRFASTLISQSTVSTRIPQPIVWRWRPHAHWPRCSTIPHASWRNFDWWRGRSEPSATNGGLLVARWSKRKFKYCRRSKWWSGEAGYGRPPGRTAPVATTSGTTATAVSTTNQRCLASVCKLMTLLNTHKC